MVTIKITIPNSPLLGLHHINSEDDIQDAMGDIEITIRRLFAADIQQRAYQNKFQISDSDIAMDFNGDMYSIARDVRGLDDSDMAEVLGLDEALLTAFDFGYVKPSKEHFASIANHLYLPYVS